jgi:hypothetical protein
MHADTVCLRCHLDIAPADRAPGRVFCAPCRKAIEPPAEVKNVVETKRETLVAERAAFMASYVAGEETQLKPHPGLSAEPPFAPVPLSNAVRRFCRRCNTLRPCALNGLCAECYERHATRGSFVVPTAALDQLRDAFPPLATYTADGERRHVVACGGGACPHC